VRDPEDLRDDRDRQERAVALDEVDGLVVAAGEVVEQLVGDVLGPVLQSTHRLHGEDARHELAVPGVLGRLDGQQRRRRQRSDGGAAVGPPTHGAEQPARAEVDAGVHVGAAEHLLDDRVRGRDVREGALVQRPARAHLLEEVERQASPCLAVAAGRGRHDQASLQVAATRPGLDPDARQRMVESPARQRRRLVDDLHDDLPCSVQPVSVTTSARAGRLAS
jgi:hypothetical protein